MKEIKILSWNACLGALNKIDYIKNIIKEFKPDVAFIQEAEISQNMQLPLLNIIGYDTTLSSNSPKKRLLCYTKTTLKNTKTIFNDLELIRVETNNYEIYGLYRPFKTPQNMSSSNYLTNLVRNVKETNNKSKKNYNNWGHKSRLQKS